MQEIFSLANGTRLFKTPQGEYLAACFVEDGIIKQAALIKRDRTLIIVLRRLLYSNYITFDEYTYWLEKHDLNLI